MSVKTLSIGSAAVVALATTAFVVYGFVERRRLAGAIRIASTLAANASWWREQRALTGELLYVAIGDSAAQGIGASRPGLSYVGLVANHVRQSTGRSVRVVNLSVSGARVREALAGQLHYVHDLQPDIVTVSIGANDMGLGFEATRFARELDALYGALPVHTIVADVPSHYVGFAERTVSAANAIVRHTAERYDLIVAPLHDVTRRSGAAWYVVNQVAADFFHPNDRGYRMWASAFFPAVDRRLAEL